MPLAVIALEFDPLLRLGERGIRFETMLLAAGILGAILVAARAAQRTPAGRADAPPAPGETLRPDDLVFLLLAAVPGAVVGGRVGYLFLHLDYYGAHPAAILDPSQGSLELGLAIVGGALTGGVAARLLGEPAGRWFHVAALPLLAGIAVGKLALALGGTGQGQPANLPWATAYLGPGPWGSLAPELPSHPAQVYEAAVTAIVLGWLIVLSRSGAFARRDGRLFAIAVAGWAVARTLVAATWRDTPLVGPLVAGQLLSLAIAAGCVAILVVRRDDRGLLDSRMAELRGGIEKSHPSPDRLPGPADSPRGSIVRRPGGETTGSPDEL